MRLQARRPSQQASHVITGSLPFPINIACNCRLSGGTGNWSNSLLRLVWTQCRGARRNLAMVKYGGRYYLLRMGLGAAGLQWPLRRFKYSWAQVARHGSQTASSLHMRVQGQVRPYKWSSSYDVSPKIYTRVCCDLIAVVIKSVIVGSYSPIDGVVSLALASTHTG